MSGRRNSHAPSSIISSDSDSDMWSVASDDEEVFGPRLDASALWALLQKAHPGFNGQEPSSTSAPSRIRSSRREERETRCDHLGEHGQELLSWYVQRVGELERENKALRCELVKDELAEAVPLPRFRSGRFDIAGSDGEDEGSEKEATKEGSCAGNQVHSLISLFDVDWQRVGAENSAAIAKSLSRCGSAAVTRLPSVDAYAAEEESPEPDHPASGGAASHLLALERLLVSLSEEDAKLIWLQFARYESEIGYLRSVISSYEDICLKSGNLGVDGPIGAQIRGLSRRRFSDLSRPRRPSHKAEKEETDATLPSEERARPEAAPSTTASGTPAPVTPAERSRRRSRADLLRSASIGSCKSQNACRGSAHHILQSAGISLLERSGIVPGGLVRRGRRLSRPNLDKPGPARAPPPLQNIEAFLAMSPASLPGQTQPEPPAAPAMDSPTAPAKAANAAGISAAGSPSRYVQGTPRLARRAAVKNRSDFEQGVPVPAA